MAPKKGGMFPPVKGATPSPTEKTVPESPSRAADSPTEMRSVMDSPALRSFTDSPAQSVMDSRSITDSPTKRSVTDSPSKRSVTGSMTNRSARGSVKGQSEPVPKTSDSRRSISRQSPDNKIVWLIEQMMQQQQQQTLRETEMPPSWKRGIMGFSQKKPLPPIACQRNVLDEDVMEELLRDTLAADPPSIESLSTEYQQYVTSHDTVRQSLTLHQLGLAYLHRANTQEPASSREFLVSSILLNCAFVRSNYDKQKHMLVQKIGYVQRDFLKRCAGIFPKAFERFYFEEEDDEIDYSAEVYPPGTKYRGLVADARRAGTMFLSSFHGSWDRKFATKAEGDPEQHRAGMLESMEGVMTKVNDDMKHMMKILLKDCEEKLEKPPCPYAILGLGDIAVNNMTPSSDIEFVVVVADTSASNLKYFHNLCDLITLNINSLGETPLTHAGLDMLSDFYNKHITQFADGMTPCGTKINQHKRAPSVSPYCLHGYKIQDDLIKSPKEMANMVGVLQKKGLGHLAAKFYQVCLLHGCHDLFNTYKKAITSHFSPVNLLEEDRPKNLAHSLAVSLTHGITTELMDDDTLHPFHNNIQLHDLMNELDSVKQIELIARLANHCPLKSTEEFLSSVFHGALENWRFLLGLSYVLRLSHDVRQQSARGKVQLLQPPITETGEAMFGWNVDNLLEHFYVHYTPLWKIFQAFARNPQNLNFANATLHDDSAYNTSKAYYRLNKPQRAIEHLKSFIAALHKKRKERDSHDLWKMYSELGHVALQASNTQLSKALFTRAMETKDNITDPQLKFTAFVYTWYHLGLVCYANNDFDKAITYYEESLTMAQDNDPSFLKTEAGRTLQYKVQCALARCKQRAGGFRETIVHSNLALTHWQESACKHNVRLQRNLLLEIAEAQLQLTQHKDCTVTLRKVYSLIHSNEEMYSTTMHMATTLRLLSQLMGAMGKTKQSEQYGSAAYHMAARVLDTKCTWLQDPPTRLTHPDCGGIVAACREFAQCAGAGGDLAAATRAMEILINALYRPSAQPVVQFQQVTDCNILGHLNLKYNQPLQAYNSFQKSLETLLKIFNKKQNLHMVHTHCQIGRSLNALNKHENALDSFTVAVLQVDVCLPQGEPHEILADIYEQMAEANHHLRRYDKATTLFDDCIKIRKKLYGDVHPVIAESLKHQGMIFYKINDERKAVQYLEQAVRMIQMINGQKAQSAELAKLLNMIAIVYEKLFDYNQAEQNYQLALAMYESVNRGKVSEQKVDILQRLGHMYRTMGDAYKAISTHKQCLEGMRKLLGTDNMRVCRLLAVIANHYQHNQLYAETIRIYENAITIYRKVQGSIKSPEVGDWLINLAKCYEVIGEKDKAADCHHRALEINQSSSQDVAAREVYMSLKKLAETAESKGLFDQALMLHKQSLDQCYKIYGKGKPHPDTVSALEAVAMSHVELLMYDEALDHNLLLLEMLDTLFSRDKTQPQIAEALNRAGVICEAVGRTMDAIKYYQDALTMFRTLHKGDHIKTASCLAKLGHALDLSGEGNAAIEHLNSSLQMLRNLKLNKGPKSAIYCDVLFQLGLAMETHPNFAEALAVHEECFEAWREYLTIDDEKKTGRIPQDIHIADCYHALGRTHVALENYDEGIKCLLEHLHMKDKIQGKKKLNMNYARLYTELGNAYKKAGNMEQAIVELSNANRIIKQVKGEDRPHLHVAKCLSQLAVCYHELGLRAKAMETTKEAVSIYERVLSLDSTEHAVYVELTSLLGDLYLDAGKPRTALKHYQKTFQYYMSIHADNTYSQDVNAAMKKVVQAKDAIEKAKEAKKAAEEERINKRKAKLEAKKAALAGGTQ